MIPIYIYAGWWLSWYTYPSEKYESWSVGMMKFPIYENIKSVPNHQSYIYIYTQLYHAITIVNGLYKPTYN